MVTLAVMETKALLVTVSVYLVVDAGLTLTATPLVAVTLPGVITPVPPAKTPVSMVLLPWVMVEELATKLAMVGGGMITVTVTVEVTELPAPLVTVRVYCVVVVGLTVTAVPLVAARLPGVMTPVPLAKTPVSMVLSPKLMVGELATKLVMVGASSTVTVAVAVTADPVVGVTVRVYVVVEVGLTVAAAPLLAAILPGVITPVPFEKTPVRVVLFPFVMVAGAAAKLVMDAEGGGGALDPPHPVKPDRPRPAKPRQSVKAQEETTKPRLMKFPVYMKSRSIRKAMIRLSGHDVGDDFGKTAEYSSGRHQGETEFSAADDIANVFCFQNALLVSVFRDRQHCLANLAGSQDLVGERPAQQWHERAEESSIESRPWAG